MTQDNDLDFGAHQFIGRANDQDHNGPAIGGRPCGRVELRAWLAFLTPGVLTALPCMTIQSRFQAKSVLHSPGVPSSPQRSNRRARKRFA
jgi:hypothetical protein